MIWGLDQDTAKHEITPSEFSNRTSETATGSISSVTGPQNPTFNTNIGSTTPGTEQKVHHPNFIDPIDLGHMLAPHVQDRTYHPPQIETAHTTSIGVTDTQFRQRAHHERHSNKGQELGVGLKPLPRRNETYKNAKPLVTTQPVVGSSLPIIILESQPQSISVPTKRRQSAMEIAQQYRKNQALFQPVTRSQWPSNPSYPPAMQAIHLPTLQAEAPDLSLSNQTRVYNHSASDIYLASSAAINSQAISAYDLHPAGLSRIQKVLASPGSDLGSYPRPPPNTPMNALAKSRMANVPLQVNHLPASPDSPSATIRSLQHSKVAPLSRLSHRRLSAVLESSEDQNDSVGMRSLSPPPFQQNFHLSRPLIPDGSAHPFSYTNLAKNRQNYYQQPENAPKANATLAPEDFARLTIDPFTPGWTQSQVQPRIPLVKVDSQPVHRDHKTGKAGSSGKAKGSGQKNHPVTGKRNRSKKKIANGMVVIAA